MLTVLELIKANQLLLVTFLRLSRHTFTIMKHPEIVISIIYNQMKVLKKNAKRKQFLITLEWMCITRLCAYKV